MFRWDSPAPTVTELVDSMAPVMQRRRILLALAGAACPSLWAGEAKATTLAAAWQRGSQQYLGLLLASDGRLEPRAALPMPTRPHGLLVEPGGSVLAFARRPGDWLLRWHPKTGQTQWQWQDDDRRLNGHGVHVGEHLIATTETDRETGQGWLGVRDRATLDLIDAWPTHGRDPHQLLVLPQALGRWPAGTLLVANGGVLTRPETGRSKVYGERLDASLVALAPESGRLLGQWRLDDPYLSIRHLAWHPQSRTLGIALQAEHATEAERHAAPVLAVWEGERLLPARSQPALGGYGGDIVALPSGPLGHPGGFAVACTRSDALAWFSADGHFARAMAHAQSCALACNGGSCWNAGRDGVLVNASDAMGPVSAIHSPFRVAAELQIDNHWQLYI